MRLTKEEFASKAMLVHQSRFDYSKVAYTNNKTKVCITCPVHGEFWQTPTNHLQGKGCPSCGRLSTIKNHIKHHKAKHPDLSHVKTPEGSKAVPVGTKGDYALVDEDDYDKVMEYNWYLTSHGYVESKINGESKKMHRFIMNCPDDMEVDHRFHNKLDNRKSQLRVCTRQENSYNTRPTKKGYSKYKGVSWDKGRGKWRASLKINNKSISLGRFTDEIEAAKAYDAAAKKHFKDFARLNTI